MNKKTNEMSIFLSIDFFDVHFYFVYLVPFH